MVDIADRLTFLITQEGSRRAVERKYGISVRTQGRILTNPNHILTKKIRAKVHRGFRNNAPQATKDREAKGKRVGWALNTKANAIKLQRSFEQAGVNITVVAQQKYTEALGGSVAKTKTQYGKGLSVQEAEAALEVNFQRLYDEYKHLTIIRIGEPLYRIYPRR